MNKNQLPSFAVSSFRFGLLVCSAAALLLPAAAFGQPVEGVGLEKGFNKVEDIANISNIETYDKGISEFILRILTILTAFLAVVAVAAIVYGGFVYITSAGSDERAQTGKKIILYAVIGLLIVGVAALMVNVIINEIIKK